MSKLIKFDPPAFLNDFNDKQKLAWSELISEYFNESICVQESEIGKGKCQFYNPLLTDTPDEHDELPIFWSGFPEVLKYKYETDPDQAYIQAEKLVNDRYRLQDEYCEWYVEYEKDSNKIKRVTFTCEGPEYWTFLGEVNPDKLLELYREYVNFEINKDDLFENGKYNPYNIWNTKYGAMHLTHPSNTLGAEIRLAADATIIRKDSDNNTIVQYDDLIRCGKFGVPNRASDPQIGGKVNDLARLNAYITLRNPVGLYIDSLNTSGWITPNGSDAQNYWRIVRGIIGENGNETFGVRAIFEVPENEEFTVSDIFINNLPIKYGGQIAEKIAMKLTGIACRYGEIINEPHTCRPDNFAPRC